MTSDGYGWEQTVENNGRHDIKVLDVLGGQHIVPPGETYTGHIARIIHGDKPAHYTVR